jgi:Putative peptidase (DUF1758)
MHPVGAVETNVHYTPSEFFKRNVPFVPTARVMVRGSEKTIAYRAMLDDCASFTYISEAFARELKLKRFPTNVKVTGISGVSTRIKEYVKIELVHSDLGREGITVNALVTEVVSRCSPSQKVQADPEFICGLLHSGGLADPQFDESLPIEILLGSDVLGKIYVPNVEIKMHKGTRALMIIYGWSVAGFMPPASGTYDLTQVSSIDDIENGDDAVNQVESADSIDEESDLIFQINEENKIDSLKNFNKQAVVDTPRDRASTSSDDRTRVTRGDQPVNSKIAHGIRRSPRLAKLQKAACSLLMIFALIMPGNASSAMLKETKVQQ